MKFIVGMLSWLESESIWWFITSAITVENDPLPVSTSGFYFRLSFRTLKRIFYEFHVAGHPRSADN